MYVLVSTLYGLTHTVLTQHGWVRVSESSAKTLSRVSYLEGCGMVTTLNSLSSSSSISYQLRELWTVVESD